ncbi:MAG: tRNA lysidine(34) synthetase TilS, partial [Lachnospiraceae bacterium]|nr:tRNA lysidine(34) synthetase TilS [Lachnospiraceae bacterium]
MAGVSGGADSVCLLLFLNSLKDELGLEIFAVHVNHGVRGEEADRDEDFTTKLCERLSIPCTVATRDVPAAAKLSGRSEEEEGRLARYEAFEEECKRRSCSKIAVAHNRDDNAETVLLNLARGSGLHGLCGIRPVSKRKSGITVIRPLLCVDKQRITGFLEGRGEPFCFDSTNATDDYSRNYIRNNILPAFEERINSQASLHIALAAQTLSEADDFICAERDGAMRKLEESGV